MARYLRFVLAIPVFLFVVACSTNPTVTNGEDPELVAKAQAALQHLVDSTPKAKEILNQAKAVIVFPDVVKDGLIVGAEGGKGVMFGPDGKVLGYYRASAVSYGLQAGAQSFSEALFLMTNSAITTLTSDAGLSVGVGPTVVVVDAGTARSMTTTTVQSDVYAFLFNEQSLMAYLGIQGQTIDVDKQPGTGAFVGKQNSALASGNPAPRPQQQQVQQAPPIGQPRRAGSNGRYDVVRVFFGTDRGATIDSAGTPQFNGDHATTLTYGSVDVSIPRDHEIGRIESPSVMRLEFSSDSSRDVTILGIGIATYDQFLSEIRSTALNASTPSVLLFIHGYWVTFEDAALRTAQMAYDLDFVGAPVFFSWPARGDFLGYLHDEQAIERAQGDIEKFVAQILAASPGANLYVIAHSMGTRGMTRALVNFARDHPSDASRIREVILAAPDIDTDVFVSQIAPSLVAIGAPVTLYASSTDRALRLSEWIHGGPRAGDAGDHLVLLKGIETVDVTNVDTDLAGHSYVGDRRTVLSDLYDLIQSDKRASKRFGLSQQTRNGMDYWVFRH